MDTLLLQKALPPSARHFSRIAYVNKPARVVLPVFFRQADACVVTRRHLETMSELNPQIGNKLRVLAVSPAVVPSMLAFLAEKRSPDKDRILTEMKRLSDSPAGQQLLTLLQADSIEERPASCVDQSFGLIAEYHHLVNTKKDSQKIAEKPAERRTP